MAGELVNMVIVPAAKQSSKFVVKNAPRIAKSAVKVAALSLAGAISKEGLNKVFVPLAKNIIK